MDSRFILSTARSAFKVAKRNAGSASDTLRMSPAARIMVNNHRINASTIKGTGKDNMITKGDVINALSGGLPIASVTQAPVIAASFVPPTVTNANAPITPSTAPVNNNFTDIPNTNMRKIIAKRLTESKAEVPHFYSDISVALDDVLKLRKTLQKDFNINVSVNDIVIKAAALALRDVPEVNMKFDTATGRVVASNFDNRVDISIAVATPTGLITPILTAANTRGLLDINTQVKDLAGRARAGKLKPEEFQGGSFSISNLGMYSAIEPVNWVYYLCNRR